MAKWGEGDPRWIVEERPDAKNVNNWHWYASMVTGLSPSLMLKANFVHAHVIKCLSLVSILYARDVWFITAHVSL